MEDNKEKLITELFNIVKETLNMYSIRADITNGQNFVDIHDSKKFTTNDSQGIRIRFEKFDNKYKLTQYSINKQYDANIEIINSLIKKIIT